jgi:hypothetical protein
MERCFFLALCKVEDGSIIDSLHPARRQIPATDCPDAAESRSRLLPFQSQLMNYKFLGIAKLTARKITTATNQPAFQSSACDKKCEGPVFSPAAQRERCIFFCSAP